MDRAFPFGLPGPTALYMCLYVATLALHALLLAYVLAGTAWVAIRAVAGRRDPDLVGDLLRDWLPFALGAAITAGVAPLLFLQILHQDAFYTANLLLFHRWMAVVPVLIAGFYLLYLVKSGRLAERPRVYAAAAAAAALCFLFVAWSFTENHLLSMDREAWPDFYGSGRLFYTDGPVLARLGIWIGGAFPLMAAVAAWQAWSAAPEPPAARAAARHLALAAIAGLFFAALCAALYVRTLPAPARDALTGRFAGPWLIAGATALAIQLGAWALTLRRGQLDSVPLALASAAALVCILAATIARESIRLAALDLDRLAAVHARAAAVDGLPAFLFFLAANTAIIIWAIRLTRRGLAERAG